MIADYFPPRLRGRAMACIVMSITLGSGCSYLIGGGMAALVPGAEQVDLPLRGLTYGWQLTFFAAALPGFLIAVLLLFIGEPARRENVPQILAEGTRAMTLGSYARHNRHVLFCLMAAAGLVALVSYAIVAWMTALYVRHFDYTVAGIGPSLGAINIVAGLPGGLLGGYLSDYFADRPSRGGRFNVMCIGTLICIPPLVLWPLLASAPASLACLAALMFIMPLIVASIPSALQAIVPNQFRGQTTAVLYLINGLFGVAFGPLLIALGTDYLFPEGGLRQSLLVILPTLMVLACLFALLGRPAYERARRELPE
jgi:MFS family permease